MKYRNFIETISQWTRESFFFKRVARTASNAEIALHKNEPNEVFATKMYRRYTGKTLNLENPRSFNEKLWWLKIHYRNPLQKVCSDKYRVREYVSQMGLPHLLTRLYGVYDRADDVDFDLFKEEVFLKCNLGSACNIIYDPSKRFNRRQFIWDFNSALQHDYYQNSREWNYKDVPAKIICEEVLRDKDGNLPRDYKFMCFGGKPKLLFLSEGACDSEGRHSVGGVRFTNIYDMDFKLVPMRSSYPVNANASIVKPDTFETMKKYASILSEPFPHCRVDFYTFNNRVYFGELTFYHSGGCGVVEPEEWANRMGDWIDLSQIKNEYLA